MNDFLLWMQNHGTKVLAVAVGTLTALTSTDIIPASHLKYYMAAITVLTYWRGLSNSNATITTQAAKTIISQHAAIQDVPAVEEKPLPVSPGPAVDFIKPGDK